MKYSCFNETKRCYDVYEDARGRPMNADLPTPSVPASSGGIGAPARECGRTMPADARYVGTSPTALGIVVRCRQRALASVDAALGASGSGQGFPWGVAIAGLIFGWATAAAYQALTEVE